jgi:hypothetical protein
MSRCGTSLCGNFWNLKVSFSDGTGEDKHSKYFHSEKERMEDAASSGARQSQNTISPVLQSLSALAEGEVPG